MVIKHHTENYEDFCTFMDKFDPKGQVVHILFEGAVDPVTKQSWCSDCVEADPIIESHLSLLPENSHFIISIVGDRPTWKDAKNPFRTDKRFKLMVIPTLIRWKSPHRLEGEQLANPDLVEMMFTDDIEDSADFKNVKVDVQTPIPTASQ
ncbi:thioredoxin domain-containing protein 17-like isoform X2 [Chrysoperla carnea]|uniref:thioredoxin domain-containing protein 17-like isoform X2 n=1 Tax=Chrysoperla carnea TaxID=189513 RepID=UPI001D073259|nr:thioredoxin domain-containing protein 17-like isoform X2 [Chrysoperla carnea]